MLFNRVTENWKSSQTFIKLRRKKFWSGTSSHVIKKIWRIFVFKKQKSHAYQEKKIFFTFYHFFVYTKPVRTKKWLEILSTIQVKWYYFTGELYELYLCQHSLILNQLNFSQQVRHQILIKYFSWKSICV